MSARIRCSRCWKLSWRRSSRRGSISAFRSCVKVEGELMRMTQLQLCVHRPFVHCGWRTLQIRDCTAYRCVQVRENRARLTDTVLVKAWCEGMGSLRSTLSSLAVPCWFIANPSAAGELPQGTLVLVLPWGRADERAKVSKLSFRISEERSGCVPLVLEVAKILTTIHSLSHYTSLRPISPSHPSSSSASRSSLLPLSTSSP
mgnify:CR=1 FL=1